MVPPYQASRLYGSKECTRKLRWVVARCEVSTCELYAARCLRTWPNPLPVGAISLGTATSPNFTCCFRQLDNFNARNIVRDVNEVEGKCRRDKA